MSASSPSITLILDQIHQLVGGELHGDGATPITAVDSLSDATAEAIAFVTSDKDLKISDGITAGALLAHRHLAELPIPHIVVTNPKLAWARVAQRLAPPYLPRGIAANLARGSQVEIGPDVSIWPSVTLGDHVTIGARVTLYPGVFVGSDSTIGDDSVLYPNVVIREGCTIGARVTIHSGTVVGSDGFGYAQDQGRHVKIPQLGGVAIEDDVEIGANVTIDRATTPKSHTRIKTGTKVDNLVQIAHNVTIGAHSIVVAQVGIAGSTTIGRHVMIGGQAGLADHITIGDQVMIAARAGVNRSLEPNQIVSGAPVMPHETWMKAQAVIPRLPELRQLVRSLEHRVATLETQIVQTPRASKKTSARARK
ncbi:MAG: UDP-3-O-(3-hydroxymyristoyl)glucosamine N-acyltransferase [Nitrospira sp. CG24D]|nr:MAG: UDP-3-O-(3-hydroxymyristoyl)glucosamine N-acyltransferase [Nitrospira sp. CG24D]